MSSSLSRTLVEATKNYLSLFDLADKAARCLSVDGKIIGRIAPAEQVTGTEASVLIPQDIWVSVMRKFPYIATPGFYLLAVDPKTMRALILQVTDAIHSPYGQGIPGAVTYIPAETSKARSAARYNVVPLRVRVKQAASISLDLDPSKNYTCSEIVEKLLSSRPGAPVSPVDPASPVVVPREEVLHKLAFKGFNTRDSITLGALGVMDNPYRPREKSPPIKFPLPWSLAVRHALILGTTGSGKTSLVKNVLANLEWRQNYQPDVWRDSLSIVMDASGDYKYIVYPGKLPESQGSGLGEEDRSILELYRPCMQEGVAVPSLILIPSKRLRGAARTFTSVLMELTSYVRELHDSARRSLRHRRCTLWKVTALSRPATRNVSAPLVVAEGDCDGHEFRYAVAPVALIVDSKHPISSLLALDPFLSSRARENLGRIDEALYRNNCLSSGGSLADVLEVTRHAIYAARTRQKHVTLPKKLQQYSNCANKLKESIRDIHERTLQNLENRLASMIAMGIWAEPSEPVFRIRYAELAEHARQLGIRSVIVDLSYAEDRFSSSQVEGKIVKILLGYNVMTSAIRDRQEDKGPLRTLMVFDEAHLFFPRETWESEEWMKVLSDALRRLMRLGRSRGIAVVLSTHRHSDVSNLIFTLTNTKIYFRTDVKSVKDLGLPDEYRETLPFFRDHAAVIQSLHVMGGYASLVGGPALPGHRIG